MKFSLLQENLNNALSTVSRFVTAKAQLPILSHIFFQSDSGRLQLSATNLELGINYWLGAKISQDGAFTVPAREITEFVSYLPPGKLDLTLSDKNLLTLTSPKAESTFTTTPPADFPALPPLDHSKSFDLDLPLLSQAVSQVAFAAAADDTRPVLTAVYWQFTDKLFIMAATDGFRLSLKKIKLVNPIKFKDAGPVTFLIPARTLIEVTKLARSAKTVKIGLTADERQVVFLLEDTELVSRLVEGEFPDFQKIMPQSTATKVLLGRAEFSQTIRIASVFARESANVVKFSFKDNRLRLSANAPQVGQNRADVDAKITGPSLEIAFNYKFVTDFLDVCLGDQVTLELNEALTPAIFTDSSVPDFTHIIMPVRIQD